VTLKLPTCCRYLLVTIGIVAIAPGAPKAASPAVASAIMTLEKIPADSAKFETYCKLLGHMESMPDDDAAKYEALERQLDAVIDSYGTDVSAAWDTVSEIDPETEDGKAVAAAFDAIEGKCPEYPGAARRSRRALRLPNPPGGNRCTLL
jgi:hypothetical protein